MNDKEILEQLLQVGLETRHLDLPVKSKVDQNGKHHAVNGCSTGTRKVVTTLKEYTESCCDSCARNGARPPLLVMGEQYLDVHGVATHTYMPDDPVSVRRLIRATKMPFATLRQLEARRGPELGEVHRNVHRDLVQRYETLKAHLRSPLMLQAIRAECRMHTGGSVEDAPVLYGVAAYKPLLASDGGRSAELLDTIVLATWTKMTRLGNFVGTYPKDVSAYVEAHEGRERYGDFTGGIELPGGVETEKYVETIAGVWDPGSESALGDFHEAVKAASILVA